MINWGNVQQCDETLTMNSHHNFQDELDGVPPANFQVLPFGPEEF